MKIKKSLPALFLMVFIMSISSVLSGANVTSVSGVTLNPANPAIGQSVTVTWTFNIDNASNKPYCLVVVSDQSVLRNGNTPAQEVLVGDGCVQGGLQVNSGGCNLGNNMPAGSNTVSETMTIPTDLIPGNTYYIAVGMGDYNVYMNPGLSVQQQNYASFTIPLPPPYIKLNKVAEGTAAAPGGLILYTVFYDTANTNGVVISDVLPPETDFVSAYDGGVFAGNTVTWNIGNVTSPKTGKVSFLASVKGTTPSGQIIHNTSTASSSGSSAASNDAPVTVGVSLSISKFASPSTVGIGNNMTFTLSYTNNGYALGEYVDFSSPSDIAGWTTWGCQSAPNDCQWQVTNGYLEQSNNSTGTNYPNIIKPSPALHDAMYITDLQIPSEDANQDAVFEFNVVDQNNHYQLVMESDSQDLTLYRTSAGTRSTLSTKSYAGSPLYNDTWYTMKVQVNGSNIKVRLWKRGTTEPTTWDLDFTDPAPILTAGTCGYQSDEGRVRADNLKIFTPVPATHLHLWDTLPACITFVNCDQGCTYNSGVVSWDFPGVIGNTVNAVSFWASADACANNSAVVNSGWIDSDEPAAPVLSNNATVIVGSLPSPTVTPTVTVTMTSTTTLTLTPTYTFTSSPTITPTMTPVAAVVDMKLSVSDYDTMPGGLVKMSLAVENTGGAVASGITIWDSVPANTSFETASADNLAWTLTGNLFSTTITGLAPGQTVTLNFVIRTDAGLQTGQVINIGAADASFNDPTSPVTLKHSASNTESVSVGDIVVYPNPFNPKASVGGMLKFANIPSGGRIFVYTISGEMIITYEARNPIVYWNGTNSWGKVVSPGVYYYVITWNDGKNSSTGKIFIVSK